MWNQIIVGPKKLKRAQTLEVISTENFIEIYQFSKVFENNECFAFVLLQKMLIFSNYMELM